MQILVPIHFSMVFFLFACFRSSSLFTKDQSSQQDIGEGPNVKPSFESSTANSPRPPYHVNPDSTIQTLPTSLLPTASVAKMVQGCDEISQSFAKQDFGSITQRTSVSNERFQSSRITCDEGVERLYVSPKEAVQRLPFPTVKSPEVRTISPTQIKDQLPGAVRDGSIRSNVKIGERSPLSPNTIHVSSTYTSTSAAQESVLLPGKVFERFSRSSGGTSDGSSTSPSQLCRTSPLSPTTTSERFSRSPEKNPESSPMLPCTSVERFPQSAADITAGSPLQHARMIDRHSHSPAGIPEKSPVPPKMTERFPQCLVGINEISVKPPSIVVERFSGSSAGMSASYSIQRPRITNRFSPPAMGITEAPSILSPREVDKFPHAVVRTQPPTIGIHEGSPQKPIGMVDKYPPSSTGGSPMPSKNSPTQIPEGSRQPPTRMLDKFSHSSVGIYNGFSLSPERMIDRCSQSSVGISEGSPQPPSIMVNRYPQSPLEIHEGSPRPPTTGMLEQYTQSPVRLPEESLQPTSRMVERYPQSSFATFESPPQSCAGKRDGSSFTQRLPCNSPISHVGETEPCSNAPVTTRSGQGVSQCSYSSVMGQSSMYGVGNAQLSVPRPLDSETSHLGQTVQNNSYQRNVLNELSSNYSKNICRMPSDQRNLANIHGQSIESNFLIATSRRDNTRDVMQGNLLIIKSVNLPTFCYGLVFVILAGKSSHTVPSELLSVIRLGTVYWPVNY